MKKVSFNEELKIIQKACVDEAGEIACYTYFENLVTEVADEYEITDSLSKNKVLSFCWFYFPIILKKYVVENAVTDFSSYYREYIRGVIDEYVAVESGVSNA